MSVPSRAALTGVRASARRRAALTAFALLGALGCSDSSGPGGGGGGRVAVAELSPSFAPRYGDSFRLTITGTGFVDGSRVRWDSTTRAADFVDGTQLSVSVNAWELLKSDTIAIGVVNPDGAASGTLRFIIGPPAPNIAWVSPPTIYAPSAAVTLSVSGENFFPESVVLWNGSPRPTTFVSATALEAALTAADVEVGSMARVVVTTPNAGPSDTAVVEVRNSSAQLASISPYYAAAGSAPTTITLTGTRFVRTSVVRWNGTELPTTYVDSTRLTAVIPATSLAAAGTARVDAWSPAPGGGGSVQSRSFTVGIGSLTTLALRANDVIADPTRGRIYASVASSDSTRPNTIAKIDPATGTVEATVAIGRDPRRLAISGDGQYLYVGLDSTSEIARVELATFTAGPKFALGAGNSTGALAATDIDVLPGAPTSVAVALRYLCCPHSHDAVAVYDNGVRRASMTSDTTTNSEIEFTSGATTLYGVNTFTTRNEFGTMTIGAGGVTLTSTVNGVISGNDMTAAGGRLYLNSGLVFDPATATAAGTFVVAETAEDRWVRPDLANNRVHFVAPSYGVSSNFESWITAYDATTYAKVAEIAVPGVRMPTGRVVRWGTDGLAFPSAGDRLVLVRTSLVAP